MPKANKPYFSEPESLWVYQPEGEIDISNADVMKEELRAAFEERKANIKVDMGALTYIDSTGLGVIIGIHEKLKGDGFKVAIVNPKDNVKQLLKITNLYSVLVEE